MDDKENFLFYKSWLELIEDQYPNEPEIQKDLIVAIVRYGCYGEKTFPCERMFLKQAFVQIDSAKAKWSDIREKRSAAGRKGGLRGKGGAPQGNQNAKKTKANNSKQNHNVNGNVNVNVNDNDNDNTINNINHVVNEDPSSALLPTKALSDQEYRKALGMTEPKELEIGEFNYD